MTGSMTELVHRTVPEDAVVLVVSRGDEELLSLGARQGWHFPQTADGVYAGHHPADSAGAIAHLEELRAEGAGYLVFPSAAFWWLDHYDELRRHLERSYRRICRDDSAIIYRLEPPTAVQRLIGSARQLFVPRPAPPPAADAAPRPVEPPPKPATPPKRGWKRRVRNSEMTAWRRRHETGHEDRALRVLESIAFAPGPERKRHWALWELANIYLESGSEALLARAAACLDLLAAVEQPPMDPHAVTVLRCEALRRLGRRDEAWRACAEKLAASPKDLDLLLAMANVWADAPAHWAELAAGRDAIRLGWWNAALAANGLEPISLASESAPLTLDAFAVNVPEPARRADGPLVTVIFPIYNAEAHVETAVRSVLSQTWRNLEVLLVDDASTDGTCAVLDRLAAGDPRVRVIRGGRNGGPYVARNRGLAQARGEFVTCHDADDWSHPRKLERQVDDLLANPGAFANMSEHVRVDERLLAYRRGNPGYYVFPNMSSLLLRREEMLARLGYWDEVRFAGDSEFKARIERVFGSQAIRYVQTGITSILRHRPQSLTAQRHTGYAGFMVGVRREYAEAYQHWHESADSPATLRLESAPHRRAFAVPELMLRADRRPHHVDLVLMSDFRFPGGTSSSNAQEIAASVALGLTVGLVQADFHRLNPQHRTNPKVRRLIDGERVRVISWGETVHTDLVIVRMPAVLEEPGSKLPRIVTDAVRIVNNQPPVRTTDDDAELMYDIAACDRNARRLFGVEPVWHPIGPMAREGALLADPAVRMADGDWVNLIDVAEWRCERTRPWEPPIVIGRHSRDHWVKWLASADELRAAYPAADDIRVRVLGGADVPRRLLERLPENWQVHEFGALEPRDFLAGLDFFVYFTHPRYLEAFGRSIFEAMAVGVPVILPPQFRTVFGAAATYVQPAEVGPVVRELFADRERYVQAVDAGRRFVEQRFGFDQHRKRLTPLIRRLRGAGPAGQHTSAQQLETLPLAGTP